MASPRNTSKNLPSNLEAKNKGKSFKAEGKSAIGEGFMQNIMGRVLEGFNSIGSQAIDDLKLGVGRGWTELKSGIDTGIDSATDGMKNAWREFSGGIDRAMEGFLPKQENRSPGNRQ